MKLKVFIGTTLFGLIATSTLTASAQGDRPTEGTARPTDGAPRTESSPPREPASPPPSEPALSPEAAAASTPSPAPHGPTPDTATAQDETVPEDALTNGPIDDEMADTGTIKIGETLSPLVVTAGLGYAYASVNHPQLADHSLSGAFLEVSAGTELSRQFRLSIAFSNFETKVRRTPSGKWEEGVYEQPTAQVAPGLHTTAGPTDGTPSQQGGVEVQKTFHANSIGPRVDFLPLGSQGPYLGLTAAVGIIQDLATRVGADLAARVGGEWRPFHSLGLGVEAGAHGQIYEDAKAAIPYAMARMTLMLEPPGMQSRGSVSNANTMIAPRTLPPAAPR